MGMRGAFGVPWQQHLCKQAAGCRQGARAGRCAGRASLPATSPHTWSQLDFDVATTSVWQIQHFQNQNKLRACVLLRDLQSHFSVLLVVKLSLFFFCNWNEEQSSINTPDSHSAAFHHCCESNTHLHTRHAQHFSGNNRQQLGVSQATFYSNSSGCMTWVNSTQSIICCAGLLDY